MDIYHAREHLTDLANHLAFITPGPEQWLADRNAELDAGNIDAIITAARQYPLAGVKAEELEGAADILALRCQHASGRWNDFVAPHAPGISGERQHGQDPGLRAAV